MICLGGHRIAKPGQIHVGLFFEYLPFGIGERGSSHRDELGVERRQALDERAAGLAAEAARGRSRSAVGATLIPNMPASCRRPARPLPYGFPQYRGLRHP